MARLVIYLLLIDWVLVSVTMAGEPEMSTPDINTLNWLAGDWQGTFEGSPFACHYTTPKGRVILSVSKEFDDRGGCFSEFERFTIKDGNIVLTPYPNGAQSVDFGLVDYDSSVKRARFTNPEHDFPTDIIYEIIESGEMLITVAGPGKDGRVEFKIRLEKAK